MNLEHHVKKTELMSFGNFKGRRKSLKQDQEEKRNIPFSQFSRVRITSCFNGLRASAPYSSFSNLSTLSFRKFFHLYHFLSPSPFLLLPCTLSLSSSINHLCRFLYLSFSLSLSSSINCLCPSVCLFFFLSLSLSCPSLSLFFFYRFLFLVLFHFFRSAFTFQLSFCSFVYSFDKTFFFLSRHFNFLFSHHFTLSFSSLHQIILEFKTNLSLKRSYNSIL